MKNIFLIMVSLILSIAMLGVLVSCASGESAEDITEPKVGIANVPAAPTPIASPDKVKLALDWFPNSNHLGLYIAEEKGYFAAENLEVEIYTPSDPSSVLATVASRSDDFGMNYQPDVLIARGEGVPVVSILGMVQHPLNSLMTLETSGLDSPADLEGKKIGYPGIPWNEHALASMLKADGLKGLEDVFLPEDLAVEVQAGDIAFESLDVDPVAVNRGSAAGAVAGTGAVGGTDLRRPGNVATGQVDRVHPFTTGLRRTHRVGPATDDADRRVAVSEALGRPQQLRTALGPLFE